MKNKNIIWLFLKLFGGVILIFIIIALFSISKKTPTPEEEKISQEKINQMMLKSIETSEKESIDKLQEEILYDQCIKDGITKGENIRVYTDRCSNESVKRIREKYQKIYENKNIIH